MHMKTECTTVSYLSCLGCVEILLVHVATDWHVGVLLLLI